MKPARPALRPPLHAPRSRHELHPLPQSYNSLAMNQLQPSKMPPPLIAAAALCGCWLLLGIVEAGLNYYLEPRSTSPESGFRNMKIMFWEIPFWLMCYMPAMFPGALLLEYWPSRTKPESFPRSRYRRIRDWTIFGTISSGILFGVWIRWSRLTDVVHRLAT